MKAIHKKHHYKRYFFQVLAVLLLSGSANAYEIDVMHFWVSPSEKSAINVFRDAYNEVGKKWVNDEQENYWALRTTAFKRIADGFPPTAIQWLISENLSSFVSSGVLRTYDTSDMPAELSQLHPLLLDLINKESKIGAIPVTVHGENWAFYNAEIMNSLGLEPPTSWDAFFEQMEQIENAGLKTIAIGPGYWEVDIIFKTMLVAEGGLDLIKAVRNGDMNAETQAQLVNAFSNLLRLRSLVKRSGLITESWNAASNAVMEGDAAVQIMGDWAKGELIHNGAKPGEDFLCAMAPGNEDSYLLAVDTFVLPVTNFEDDKKAQDEFVKVILNADNQIKFSRQKGSIPVRKDIDLNELDICGQLGYSIFSKEGAAEPSLLETSVKSYADALGTVTKGVWDDIILNAEAAKNKMLKQVDIIKDL